MNNQLGAHRYVGSHTRWRISFGTLVRDSELNRGKRNGRIHIEHGLHDGTPILEGSDTIIYLNNEYGSEV